VCPSFQDGVIRAYTSTIDHQCGHYIDHVRDCIRDRNASVPYGDHMIRDGLDNHAERLRLLTETTRIEELEDRLMVHMPLLIWFAIALSIGLLIIAIRHAVWWPIVTQIIILNTGGALMIIVHSIAFRRRERRFTRLMALGGYP
jgi:hypothetical protein